MHVQALAPHDVAPALLIAGQRPYAHCYLTALLEQGKLADLAGVFDGQDLVAVASVAGNCVSTDLQPLSALALADFLARTGRHVASIVCRAPDVALLWDALAGRWGSPRDVRTAQPLLVLSQAPRVPIDHLVRRSRADEVDVVLPCCVEMFTGEVGVSPIAGGLAPAYRRRIEQTIATGKSFIRRDERGLVFKAEIGSVSSAACQVQGVWVRPDRRGEGISAPAMAAVAVEAMRSIAPAVELYVNDFNTVARKTYERVGFEQVDTFRTVFF